MNVKTKVRLTVEVDTGWQNSDASSRELMASAARDARRIVSNAIQGDKDNAAKRRLVDTPTVELIMTEPREVEAQ